MTKYEYRLIWVKGVVPIEQEINELAAEGWRVAHIVPPANVMDRDARAYESSSGILLERERRGTPEIH